MGSSTGTFYKFPRTPHVFHSKGTVDDKKLSFNASIELINHPGLVVEEKLDGSNTGIQFIENDLFMQNRGHKIGAGEHEQYNQFKAWVQVFREQLFEILGNRFILYGEWLLARHSIEYDQLPHYFFGFDVYNKDKKHFLDTKTREKMFTGSPIYLVPVVHRGPLQNQKELEKLITTSRYGSDQAEGLYLKIESNNKIINRAKFVRESFTQKLAEDNSHWKYRQMKMNQLAEGVSIWIMTT